MSGVELEVRAAHRIEDIGQENWDAFSSGRPFTSYDWYRFGERSMPDCPPFYVSILRCGQTVARASFWLVRNEPLPVSTRLLRAGLRRFLSVRPLLVCRSPLADASGIILSPSSQQGEVLEQILSAAGAYGRSVNASFLVFDYLGPDQTSWPDWPVEYHSFQMVEPGTCMEIVWGSFDDYLAGLSKSAWKDYRRQHNQAQRLELSITTQPAAGKNIDEALSLIRNVEAKHGAQPKPWARGILENAISTGATWIEARHRDHLVGCGLLLADGDARLATLLGLDYNFPYVYFQLVYAAIREAITQGARLLRAGSGAYEFKQRLGFHSETNNYLRFSGQTRILGQLGRLVSAID